MHDPLQCGRKSESSAKESFAICKLNVDERLLHKSTLKWWGLVHTGGTREMGTLSQMI